MGYQSMNESSLRITLSPILNGSASIPVWNESNERYSGNGYFNSIVVLIYDYQILNTYEFEDFIGGWGSYSSITFSNGSASRSWNQGEELEIDNRPIPSASDYNISGLSHTYDGTPKYVTITPKAGKSQGMINIYYDGSTTAPSAIGIYTVTFDVSATSTWQSAQGLYAGQLTIYPNDSGPSAPTNVQAARTSSTTVSINWSNVSGASYYEIYSATSTDGYIYYNGSSYANYYVSEGNRSDSAVYFKVYAVNSAGERSGPSSWASVAPAPDGVDNNGFLGATLSLSNARVYTGSWNDDINEWAYAPFNDTVSGLNYIYFRESDDEEGGYLTLDEVFNGTNNVTLTNGNLSIQIGTPKEFALTNIMDGLGYDELPPDFTISDSSAKWHIFSAIEDESGDNRINCRDDVFYMYADRNVRLSWTQSYPSDWTETYVYNLNLKAGWNSVIQIFTQSSNSVEMTMKTGMFTGKVKWHYGDYGSSKSIWQPEGSKAAGNAAAKELFPRAGKPRTKQ
jgi:hypothetical protein